MVIGCVVYYLWDMFINKEGGKGFKWVLNFNFLVIGSMGDGEVNLMVIS